MRQKNKKYNFGKIFVNPIFVGMLGFCILVYITIPIVKNAQKQKKINNEIKDLENEIAKLDGNNSDLKKMINYLNSDQFVIEQARLNLNYAKEKESVTVIKNLNNNVDDPTKNKQVFDINEEKKENNILKNSNAYKWWSYFLVREL